ncbi:MAG: hypothetical protein AAFQ64_00585 [Pseudomonadota bacterium]
MKSFKPLLLLPALAACDLPPQLDENGNPILPPLPPQVQAAMPEGMPRSFVFESANGCWAVGLEAGEPRQGRPLRDAAGNWVCNDGVIPPDQIAAEAPPAS